jgi:hypothetical protein
MFPFVLSHAYKFPFDMYYERIFDPNHTASILASCTGTVVRNHMFKD